MNGPARPEHTRILFHNIRGGKSHEHSIFEDLLHEQLNLQIDIQCISEHQLDTQQYKVTQELHDKIQRTAPGQAVLQLTPVSLSPQIRTNQVAPL